jgi:hypothetical protein
VVNVQSTYCSTDCYDTARARNPHRNVKNLSARRARLKGAFVEAVDPGVVFERDEWTCHICSESIPEDALRTSGAGATIDHVIPLARGGLHSYDNVRAAHWLCNVAKGARLVAA